jgi:hypothetical protein
MSVVNGSVNVPGLMPPRPGMPAVRAASLAGGGGVGILRDLCRGEGAIEDQRGDGVRRLAVSLQVSLDVPRADAV